MIKTTLIALATFATLALSASPSDTATAEASLTGNVLRNTAAARPFTSRSQASSCRFAICPAVA